MLPELTFRMLLETDWRLLARFAGTFGLKGAASLRRFRRRLREGKQFPPFLFISITSACNLRCQGCWVDVRGPVRQLSVEKLDEIVVGAKRRGVRFFGLLGGEPLLHEGLLDVLGRHRDCFFQVFTNGMLMTDSLAREFRRLGNVTPLVSIEGLERVSDVRRGGRDVFSRTLGGLEACRRHRLITGVATSLCRSNIEDLLSADFVHRLIDLRVHYLWYYVYRPVGPTPTPELSLSAEQLRRARRFIVRTRTWAPLLIVDAYWDADGRPICPAAAGISYHVSPAGDVEPCPPIQFSADNVNNGRDIGDVIEGSTYLRGFRETAGRTTRGCILLERPDALAAFIEKTGASDSSGRETAKAELEAMRPRPGHGDAGDPEPERHWFYRLAKRRWFFGLGSYG